jgi:hypothetical protein
MALIRIDSSCFRYHLLTYFGSGPVLKTVAVKLS